ncbi:BolA-like protein [Coemansia sp. RSA 1285]|nr:BolA-like protein [Coemansia sp. RSA 1285]
MVSAEEIETKLKENLLPGALVHVEDISGGCGNSYELLVVSDEFDKKSPLMRHRKIHGILKEEVPLIHALTLVSENAETAANQDKADKEDRADKEDPDALSQ